MGFKIKIKRENVFIPDTYLFKCDEDDSIYAVIELGKEIVNKDLSLLSDDIERAKKLCSEIFLF